MTTPADPQMQEIGTDADLARDLDLTEQAVIQAVHALLHLTVE